MAILKLNNSSLFTPSIVVDRETLSFDLVAFSKDLAETLVANQALGLSAIQVGVPYRIMAITGNPILIMVNPRIVYTSSNLIEFEEVSASFKNLHLKISRPDEIRVRYSRPNGEVVTEVYRGLTANVIQRQIDFMDGIMFYNKISIFHKEKAFRKQRRLNKNKK